MMKKKCKFVIEIEIVDVEEESSEGSKKAGEEEVEDGEKEDEEEGSLLHGC